MNKFISFAILGIIFFCQPINGFAQDITLLYTGETHASLYTCHCPSSPDGGLLRRATKIKEIRKDNPNVLLVDSGGFFAGGVLDSNKINTELDKQRTQITLQAMGMMGYDAAAIGDDEFNFGEGFLVDEIKKSKISLVSANIESNKFLPYSIKEINGIKFGIFGLTPEEAAKNSGREILKPKDAAAKTILALKNEGADIIVLLSHLGGDTDLKLAEEVEGIDVLIVGHRVVNRKDASTKINSTLILRPKWQARQLGRCVLKIEDKKIVDFKADWIRLSSEVADDPEMKRIVPACFSDKDCWDPKKKGYKGKCISAATDKARCEFSAPAKIDLTVVRPEATKTPYNLNYTLGMIKNFLPGLKVNYIDYPARKANELIKRFKINMLPAYILPEKIEKEIGFSRMEHLIEKKNNSYLVKPSFAGVSFFVGRKRIENRVDVFLTLKEKNVDKLLEVLKELVDRNRAKIDLHVHFMAFQTKEGFRALAGDSKLIDEYLRIAAVMKYYPLRWWDYAICRAKNIESTWWDKCLDKMDKKLINEEARSAKGRKLLEDNIRLTKELEISNGPTFLFENQEVFSTQDIPTIEELERAILKGE